MRRLCSSVVVVLAALVLSNCGVPRNACIDGMTSACGCASGGTGFQTCRADGTFSACSCQAVAPDMGGPKPDMVAVGRCRSDSDTSLDCIACIDNSLSGGTTGIACQPTNDRNCGHCAASAKACYNDTSSGGCVDLVICLNDCPSSSTSCRATCENQATALGRQLLNQAFNCAFLDCTKQ